MHVPEVPEAPVSPALVCLYTLISEFQGSHQLPAKFMITTARLSTKHSNSLRGNQELSYPSLSHAGRLVHVWCRQ